MKNCAHLIGYYAYLNGESITENPFKDNTDNYANWEAGWTMAYDEEKDES